MLLIVLFLCIVAMCVYVYTREHKDIFAPSLLFLISYVVSIGSAVLNIERWGIELHPVTFAVLLIGAIEFVGISLWIDRCYKKKTNLSADGKIQFAGVEPADEIKISAWKQVLTYLGCVVYCVLFYRQVQEIAVSAGGYQSFSEMLRLFKESTSVTLTASVPGWLAQMERIVMICAFIYLYFFLHNVIYCGNNPLVKRIFRNCALLIPFLTYMINGILNSDRLIILQTLVGAIVMIFILWVHRTGKNNISWKTLLILAGTVCVGLLLFYWSAEKIGRITDKGIFEYITYYCGCGIECLNQFFEAPPEPSAIIGKETFYNLNLKLYNMGILELEEFYPIHLEFRYYGDVMLGNVYTAYRRWIYDFGFVGAAVLQGIMAAFMSVFYNHVKYGKSKNNGFWLIVYSYLAYTVVFHAYDGYLYIQYVSQTGLTTLILFRLAYWFFAQMDIKFKGGFSLKLTDNYRIEGYKIKKSNDENG
jgi:oligosaccharide repeat unit polymerase